MQMTLEMPILFDQLVKLRRQQPDLVYKAIVQLFQYDPQLRWSLVLGAYQDDQISLSKAAELLDLHALELREKLIQLNIPLKLGPMSMAEAEEEIAVTESLFT
jgi:predicted HTH domain antitoxin